MPSKRKQKPFVAGKDSYVDLLPSVYAAEKVSHPSLRLVEEVDTTSDFWRLTPTEMIGQFGLSNCIVHQWQTMGTDAEAENYHGEPGKDGGMTIALKDATGKLLTVVFMRTRTDTSAEVNSLIKLATFYHEIGHVHDMENRINFDGDKTVDMTKAEAFAHHFACRKLMRNGHRYALAWYLRDPLPKMARSNSMIIREAAQAVLASPQSKEYVRYANPLYDKWYELCSTPDNP